jgi:streptogramin lyase
VVPGAPGLPSASPSATTQSPTTQAVRDWRDRMTQALLPKKGCFTSSFPSNEWQEVPCTTAPKTPYLPARGPRSTNIGNGTDISAKVTGTISTAVGSFDSVIGVTSETGTSPVNGAIDVPNAFSLQLNSNLFPTRGCQGAADPLACRGWQQFIYSNSYGKAFIEHWLINYQNTCPAGWTESLGSCFINGGAISVPVQPISNLQNLSLRGQVVSAGQDALTMAVGDNLYTMPSEDSVVDPAQGWQLAEFNVFGDGNGAQAEFNTGSEIVVRTSVDYGSPLAPSCEATGLTLETNNLSFANGPVVQQEALPAIVFTESSAGGSSSACNSATELPGGGVTPPPQPQQELTEFILPSRNSALNGITTGPDGALWFTMFGKIGRISVAGAITEFPLPNHAGNPSGIALGPDGALWFADQAGAVGRMRTDGTVTLFRPLAQPIGICRGPDGALWFTEYQSNKIGRITTDGTISEFSIPTVASGPAGIVAGPDGALWFTESNANKIGRISLTGSVTEFALPNEFSFPASITVGPDQALWFTEGNQANARGRIGRITPSGNLKEFPVSIGAVLHPAAIAVTRDGVVWFTDSSTANINVVRMAPDGSMVNFPVVGLPASFGLTVGPDGALWFTEAQNNKIGRLRAE